jgi:hypothetical protein
MQELLYRHVGTAESTRLGVTRPRQNASVKSETSLVQSKKPNEKHLNRP